MGKNLLNIAKRGTLTTFAIVSLARGGEAMETFEK